MCDVLGVARSNVICAPIGRATGPIGAAAGGRAPMPSLKPKLRAVIAPLATYGYRRAAALVNRGRRHHQHTAVNHKRVYRVMREAGWLLIDLGQNIVR